MAVLSLLCCDRSRCSSLVSLLCWRRPQRLIAAAFLGGTSSKEEVEAQRGGPSCLYLSSPGLASGPGVSLELGLHCPFTCPPSPLPRGCIWHLLCARPRVGSACRAPQNVVGLGRWVDRDHPR